jgi:hypothetical protein
MILKQNILTDLEWETNEVAEQPEDGNSTEEFGANVKPREITDAEESEFHAEEPELNAEQPEDIEQPEDDLDKRHTSNSNILSSQG